MRFSLTAHLSLTIILFSIFSKVSLAQNDYYHQPFGLSSNLDVSLTRQIQRQFDHEIAKIVSPKIDQVTKIYRSIGENLVKKVHEGEFLKNDSVEKYIWKVANNIIRSNTLTYPYKVILIQNVPTINALCMADGSIILNLGLLAKLQSENELAMTLAHEFAHHELGHIRKSIHAYVERDYKKGESQVVKIFTSKNEEESAEAMKALRRLLYNLSSFTRQNEQQADSLGLILMLKAGYNSSGAIALMERLDPKKEAGQLNFEFMLQLDSKNYPLQEDWFRKRPKVLSAPSERSDAFLQDDSLESHPNLDSRKEYLVEQIKRLGECCSGNTLQNNFSELPVTLKFQLIESCLKDELFDRSLYHALALRENFRQNPYLTSSVTKVFIFLYERRNYQLKINAKPIPLFTKNYSEALRLVNEFLHNVPNENLDEIALNFLKENFDEGCEEHYYLLWRIYRMNANKSEAKVVRGHYLRAFESGFYKEKMNKYTPYYPGRSSLSELLRGY